MTVDTKGYVRTSVKDVMHVMNIVEKTIRSMIREKAPKQERAWGLPDGFSWPNTRISPDSDMAETMFTLEGEQRTLTVHFGCDNDANHIYPGDKLILNLGCYGFSEEVIRRILEKLAHIGQCYLDRNDCDDAPNVEVTGKPMTFIDAVVQGYTSSFSFKSWRHIYAVLGTQQPQHEFLGLTEEELARCNADSSAVYGICDGRRDAAKAARADAIQNSVDFAQEFSAS